MGKRNYKIEDSLLKLEDFAESVNLTSESDEDNEDIENSNDELDIYNISLNSIKTDSIVGHMQKLDSSS